MAYDPLVAPSPDPGDAHMPSFWTATAGPAPGDDGSLDGPVDTDVAIIGAGYTGLSCAYHLARNHGIRALVLEANRPGWGCSGRNGGFARAAIGRLSYAQMLERWGGPVAKRLFGESLAAVRLVRELIRVGSIACDATEAGHLKIAHRPSRAPALAREAELLQRVFEYPAEFLDPAVLHDSHIGGTQSHGALRFPDAVALHPLKLAYGVLELARAAGARVHSASPVLAWRKEGAGHVLTTPQGVVRARQVVLATNGYTPEHLHPALRGATLPVLSHLIVTRPMSAGEQRASAFRSEHVLTDTRELLYYWRRLPDGRILFGGRGEVTDTPAGRVRQRAFLLAELKRKLPALADITVDYDWFGWVCLTADFLPHVYYAADDPSLHYAIGYQGSGVSFGLYAGKLLARRVAGETLTNPIPPTETALPRFPFARLRRLGQRALYLWFHYRDERN